MRTKKISRDPDAVYAFLAAREGNPAQVSNIAERFGCTSAALMETMDLLERQGRIRRSHGTHKASFFVPTAEFLRREQELLQRRSPPDRQLRIDPRLPDIWERCKAFRAIPSIG